MVPPAWDEVARLRVELAAAWEIVERTEQAFHAAPSAEKLVQAQAALAHWRNTSMAMCNVISDCLNFNSGRAEQVSSSK